MQNTDYRAYAKTRDAASDTALYGYLPFVLPYPNTTHQAVYGKSGAFEWWQ